MLESKTAEDTSHGKSSDWPDWWNDLWKDWVNHWELSVFSVFFRFQVLQPFSSITLWATSRLEWTKRREPSIPTVERSFMVVPFCFQKHLPSFFLNSLDTLFPADYFFSPLQFASYDTAFVCTDSSSSSCRAMLRASWRLLLWSPVPSELGILRVGDVVSAGHLYRAPAASELVKTEELRM